MIHLFTSDTILTTKFALLSTIKRTTEKPKTTPDVVKTDGVRLADFDRELSRLVDVSFIRPVGGGGATHHTKSAKSPLLATTWSKMGFF